MTASEGNFWLVSTFSDDTTWILCSHVHFYFRYSLPLLLRIFKKFKIVSNSNTSIGQVLTLTISLFCADPVLKGLTDALLQSRSSTWKGCAPLLKTVQTSHLSAGPFINMIISPLNQKPVQRRKMDSVLLARLGVPNPPKSDSSFTKALSSCTLVNGLSCLICHIHYRSTMAFFHFSLADRQLVRSSTSMNSVLLSEGPFDSSHEPFQCNKSH